MNWTLNGLTLQSNETNIHNSSTDSEDWKEYVNRFTKIWNDELENIESLDLTLNLPMNYSKKLEIRV